MDDVDRAIKIGGSGWVCEYQDGTLAIHHWKGIPWHEAKKPFWVHRCRAQTKGLDGLTKIERCACGSIRLSPFSGWMERNSR